MLKKAWLSSIPLLLLTSCGDGDGGDTLLTGFSGVVVIVLVILGIMWFVRRGR